MWPSQGYSQGQSQGHEGHELLNMEEAPEKGYTLSWSNLSYTVNASGVKKQILSNLHGILKPGTVTAVLGASGAGKSSFLDVLAGRVSPSLISGEVAINGNTEIPIRHASRYCTQEEALFSTLTVLETLMYAAHFNLPKSTPLSAKKNIVQKLLKEFGLDRVQGTIIGGPLLKGCSGGQIRRVSVASQVVGLNSGILFLDEPTSGLDSVAAAAVISSVCNLAHKQNATVIATIHQPSTETFELFTHILLLGKGSTVYFGPREAAIPYFDTIGHPIPVRANPSDAYLQLTNTDFDTKQQAGKSRVASLVSAFAFSTQHALILQQIEDVGDNQREYVKGSVTHTNGFLYQTQVLMSRAFVNAAKNPLAYWVRVAMYVALAILMGTTWMRMGVDQSTVQDRLAGLFFAVAFLSFMAVAGIPAFLEERHVFMRECANGLYGVESYLLSNLLVSVPFILIITIAFSSIAYFSMGLQERVDKFAIFVGLLFFSLMIAEAQTVFISVGIPIFVAALAITAFTNGLWMVVQGFFVQKTNIPKFWRYTFHQIDFQKYAYELFITNEMKGLTFTCNSKESNSLCSCNTSPTLGIGKPGNSSCSFRGEDVLKHYDYEDISYAKWLSIMAAIFVVFKLATYILLKIRTRQSK